MSISSVAYRRIEVTNSSGGAVRGCVRVFLAPQRGRRGDALLFEEQRTLAIELDKFTHYSEHTSLPGVKNSAAGWRALSTSCWDRKTEKSFFLRIN